MAHQATVSNMGTSFRWDCPPCGAGRGGYSTEDTARIGGVKHIEQAGRADAKAFQILYGPKGR